MQDIGRAGRTRMPEPETIDRATQRRLFVAGWLDRWRYRRLPDAAHTHLTLRLLGQYRAGLARLEQWQRDEAFLVGQQLAALGPEVEGPAAPSDHEVDSGALAGRTQHERHQWGHQVRDQARIVRAYQQTMAELEHRREKRRRLSAELDELPLRVAAAREGWVRDHEQRLAIYARARLRSFIRVPTQSAALPAHDLTDPVQPMLPLAPVTSLGTHRPRGVSA